MLWGGTLGAGGLKKFEHGHVVYQLKGDDEENRNMYNFYPRV